MKIALIGASGNAGSRILHELTARGHSVTAIVRHPDKVAPLPRVEAVAGDVWNQKALQGLLVGHDAVVSSIRFVASDPSILIDAVGNAGIARYLVVGGAGSLEVAPGRLLVDEPGFPESARPEARKGVEFLALLRATKDLDWTFLSPPALFVPGQRTGKYRVGKDALLSGEGGSTISFEDYAVALTDELERPAHPKTRFTVAY